MKQFRNYYFGLALGYLFCSWLIELASRSGLFLKNIYTQKLIVETVVLVINMSFLLLYALYENTWVKVALVLSQLLAAGLYGYFTFQMLFSASTKFSILSFILYDLFLFFNMTFFNQVVFKKTL